MPKFWRIPLPWKQSNPESCQDILRFAESRTACWPNPGSREYPSRPCQKCKHESSVDIVDAMQAVSSLEAQGRMMTGCHPCFPPTTTLFKAKILVSLLSDRMPHLVIPNQKVATYKINMNSMDLEQ